MVSLAESDAGAAAGDEACEVLTTAFLADRTSPTSINGVKAAKEGCVPRTSIGWARTRQDVGLVDDGLGAVNPVVNIVGVNCWLSC
jgi:hypothetical protein